MKWFVIAALLAGTLAAVSAEECNKDDDCPSDSCCGAKNLMHMKAKGICMKLAKEKQKCSEEAINDRYLDYCGCEEGSECKSNNPKLDKTRDKKAYHLSLVCKKKEGGGEKEKEKEKEKVEGAEPKVLSPILEALMEIGNGPGGEPPRDDDCADWEYPC